LLDLNDMVCSRWLTEVVVRTTDTLHPADSLATTCAPMALSL